MKNLWIILGVLGIIFIIAFSFFVWEVKNTDFSGVSEWFSNLTANLNQEDEESDDTTDIEINENINGEEDVVDVGEINFYTLELGRDEADIQSRRTYTFYLPVDIAYEVQGVDASSTIIVFRKDDQDIFQITNFDYEKTDSEIEDGWPDANEYSTEGGHTNIVELLDYDFKDDMYIFVDTLKIDDAAAF